MPQMTEQQAQSLYDKICEVEQGYPTDHAQVDRMREQKEELLRKFPDIKRRFE